MNNSYPKILIIGESFHQLSGGGITLSNLFKNWPEENIGIIATHNTLVKTNGSKYKNCYQLGSDDCRLIFPFKILQKKYKSGLYKFPKQENNVNGHKTVQMKPRIINLFFFIAHFFGFANLISRTTISKKMIEWCEQFNPDYIYSQLSTRDLMYFVKNLNQKLRVPVIIHIMDDWPRTINHFGIFKKYWDKVVDIELKEIVNSAFKRLSISDTMAVEYSKRYGGEWITFHNPIDTCKYNSTNKKCTGNLDSFKILYLGRIGIANKNNIKTFAKAINDNKINHKIELHIYSKDYLSSTSQKIKKLKNIFVHAPIKYDEVPKILSQFNLLYLPLDFDNRALKFSRLSMPTKMSEYMISGIPILIHAPSETAVYQYAEQKNVAFLLSSVEKKKIIEKLTDIVNNHDSQIQLSSNAISFAKEEHDVVKNTQRFKEIFSTSNN